MSERDYYEVLGLTPDADGPMVDQAYWHLARKYQSMVSTDPRARVLHDELNEAYGVLCNPRLRKEYDRFRDDLVTQGVIRAVRSPQPAPLDVSAPSATNVRFPRFRHGWTYATSGVIVALAIVGAWQSVSLLFVVPAVVVGLALSLAPALPWRGIGGGRARRVASADAGTDLRPPESPRIRRGDDPEELRASTAAVIERWRQSLGLREAPSTPGEAVKRAPSTELVEIVESERELASLPEDEPLAAVLEILRGSGRRVRTH